MALSTGCSWTSTVQVNSDVEAVIGVTLSSHRTDAATGTRCSRYTVLAADYLDVDAAATEFVGEHAGGSVTTSTRPVVVVGQAEEPMLQVDIADRHVEWRVCCSSKRHVVSDDRYGSALDEIEQVVVQLLDVRRGEAV